MKTFKKRMSRQSQLDGGVAGVEEAIVYFRPAKAQQRTVEPEQQRIDSASELEDIEDLLDIIKHGKLKYPIRISSSQMDELPSDLSTRILIDGPDEVFVTQLLSLFCSSLEGKQKMANKYAMLIHFGDGFLLAHVRAEKGMSLREEEGEIELIRRFLDIDNILSAALFEVNGEEIKFSHFTDTGSDAFRNFLGVRKRQYHYERKNIQIICYYQGNKSLEVKFEFTNDEFENVWLQDGSIELSGNQFVPIKEDRAHQIKVLRWGNEDYESVDRFKSDFKEWGFGLQGERKRYDRIHQYPSDDTEASVYAAAHATDLRDRIELTDTDGVIHTVDKGSLPDDLHVIYASNHIDIDSAFADTILQDITNDLDRSIYHPSERPAANEFQVNNITLLNIDEHDLSPEFIEFLTSTHNHAKNRTGETLTRCLSIVMLQVLKREVDEPFSNAIDQIININSGNPRDQAVVSTKENEGPGLIEYKNRQDLETEDPAATIVDHIQTEQRNGQDRKIFLWGFTEQSRQIDGFETQSWNDDRISSIEEQVNDLLNEENIDYNEFILQPIELGANGDRWAITGVFY